VRVEACAAGTPAINHAGCHCESFALGCGSRGFPFLDKTVCRIALLVWVLILFTSPAWEQGSLTQLWPEVDVDYKLNDQFRMRFLASITKSEEFTTVPLAALSTFP
jgi:hypothetical protein